MYNKHEIDKQAEREGKALRSLKRLSPKNKNNHNVSKSVIYQRQSRDSDKAKQAFNNLFKD